MWIVVLILIAVIVGVASASSPTYASTPVTSCTAALTAER